MEKRRGDKMSYTCYLGGALWPTPEKLQVKIKGKNKTLVLLNEGGGQLPAGPRPHRAHRAL